MCIFIHHLKGKKKWLVYVVSNYFFLTLICDTENTNKTMYFINVTVCICAHVIIDIYFTQGVCVCFCILEDEMKTKDIFDDDQHD